MLTDVGAIEPDPARSADSRTALLELLTMLDNLDYDFVTSTPASHARVLARPDRRRARELRDVLGWSLPFDEDIVDPALLAIMREAMVVETDHGGLLRATVRVSRVEGALFLHSAYPTTHWDSVFLGPDSYRFAQLILAQMPRSAGRILDYGAGAGVGGIVAARAAGRARLTIADVNEKALFLASINAEHAGVDHDVARVSAPRDLDGPFDLMVTHPPFMIDEDKRAYRDGGDLYGGQLSLDWVLQGVELLAPGASVILHTGASIVAGEDVLRSALMERLPAAALEVDYRELDPDIFGDELDQPAYADVERIAAVGLVATKTVR